MKLVVRFIFSKFTLEVSNLMFHTFTESYYKDFFEPPARPAKKPKKASPDSAPPRQSKVRFHEEVKVRSIKSQGKGKKLSAMPWDIEDDDDDDEDDDEDDMLGDEDEEMDDDELEDEVEEEDEEDEEGDNSDEDIMSDGLETIQRLKDDLFAEDDEDQANEGELISIVLRGLISYFTSYQVQQPMKSECLHYASKLHSWKQTMLVRKTGR